jgi:hypothetical protein
VKAFLAYRFGDEDRELVGNVETLLNSHDVAVITGTRLGGKALTPAIKERIESADALVALMTRRAQIGVSGQWSTHPWVLKELAHARTVKKRTIALVEEDVRLPTSLARLERIALDRTSPADAVLALSETIRLWKEELGNPRRLLIKPDTVGQQLLASGLLCRYRFVSPEGKRGTWRFSDPILQPGATVLYVDGVRGDEYHIEVQVMDNRRKVTWASMATPQLISVELNPV